MITKRRIVIVLLFLFAGAVVNVAVAWACAVGAWSRPSQPLANVAFPSNEQYAGQLVWLAELGWRELGQIDDLVYSASIDRAEGAGWAIRWVSEIDSPAPGVFFVSHFTGPQLLLALDVRAGWPFPSLWGGVYHERTLRDAPRRGAEMLVDGKTNLPWMQDAIHIGSRHVTLGSIKAHCVPFAPLWVGFVANSAIYAVVLFLPFAAIRFIRTNRLNQRRQRGLCASCDFDLRGADHKVCPECGVAVKCRSTIAKRASA